MSPRPALVRQLGLWSATALVVSNMIGTGIFTSTGFNAGDLGSAPWILLLWLVGALCALIGAFCYSELGVNLPSSGGEYVYLTRAFGPTWGFLSGWISFFAGFSAPIAFAALAFADYLGYFFPILRQENAPVLFGSGDWTFRLGGAQFAAGALVVLFTVLNCAGVQRTARVQNFLTVLKVATLASFIVLGFAFGKGDWQHFSEPATRWTSTPLAAQFAISLFWTYVAYSGWNAATYVAEELEQPARTLPLALAAGTALVATLYIGLNALFIYSTPLEKLKGVVAVGSLSAANLFGGEVGGIFAALMAVSLMSTVNAMVTIGPRVYYAMAQNGAFLASAARVHPRWHTPVGAILAQGACTLLLTLTPFPQLAVYIGFSLNFFAVMSVASLFRFRRDPNWRRLPVVSVLWPLMPSLFILIGAWMIYQGIEKRPGISAVSIATMAAGALVYRFRVRRG
jgi:APA family basic amino acid/polyamine antiporter